MRTSAEDSSTKRPEGHTLPRPGNARATRIGDADTSDEVHALRRHADQLDAHLADLRLRIRMLELRTGAGDLPVAPPVIQPPPAATPMAAPASAMLATPTPVDAAAAAPRQHPGRPFFPSPAATPAGAPAPADSDNVEMLIGTRWLNRVGAVILLLGIAFFLKYSFDQGWISPRVRVLMGAAGGLLLVAGGEYALFRRLAHFAVGLLGAGVGTLYLSIYAAHAVYALVSTQTAFALYCAVTALSTLIAAHGRQLPIALLGVVGGFLTPVVLSTGENRQIELLTYLLVLDAGFLLVSAQRNALPARVLDSICTISRGIADACLQWPARSNVLPHSELEFSAVSDKDSGMEDDSWDGRVSITRARRRWPFCGST